MTRKVIYLMLIAVVGMFYSCTSNTELVNTELLVKLMITPITTNDELIEYQKALFEERNISIDFSGSTFDKSGKIEDLFMKVDCNDGFAGEARASWILLYKNSYGFYRDYTKDCEIPFSVGQIE